MSQDTWARCRNEQPEVAAAFDEGRQRMHDQLVGRLSISGDTIALIYALKAFFGYVDRPAPEREAASNTGVIVVPAVSNSSEEWEAQYRAYRELLRSRTAETLPPQ